MENYKLKKLKLVVGADSSDDELLLMYLSDAERAILNKLYPMDDSVSTIPERYAGRQVEIAAYLYNKRGAEGEITHNENGINRTYESSSIPKSMLSDIVSYGSVVK